jgi:hypothetical protein
MSNDDPRVEAHRELTTATPRWVKVFGVIAIIVLLLFVILHFAGGGPPGHGPMQHGF